MWATTYGPLPPTMMEKGRGKSAQAISANAVEVALGRNAPVFREYPTATRSVPEEHARG